MNSKKEVWYKDGLAFECQECGDCCRGPGGYVWLTEEEARNLSKALNMDINSFAEKFLRNTLSGLALVDSIGGNCPLLGDDGRCLVYESRPLQCKTWPWWKDNISSQERWESEKLRCPGIGKGKIYSKNYIESEAAKDF